MRQLISITVVCLGALLAAACSGGDDDGGEPTTKPANTTGADKARAEPTDRQPKEFASPVDTTPADPTFATPTSTVQFFIRAGVDRNLELLQSCFADSATGEELQSLRDGSVKPDQLAELAAFLEGGEVMAERIDEATLTAVVAVEFEDRDEEIKLAKQEDGWKIVDF